MSLIKITVDLWWRHQMETFSALLALCEGDPPTTGGSAHKGQWRGALMSSLPRAWTNGWASTPDAGYLRRHRANYDVTVIPSGVQTYAHGSCFAVFSCGWLGTDRMHLLYISKSGNTLLVLSGWRDPTPCLDLSLLALSQVSQNSPLPYICFLLLTTLVVIVLHNVLKD